MVFTVLTLLLSSAPIPPAFGFIGVQCVPVREVVCITDQDYSAQVCMEDVSAAVALVNEAVGRTILRFSGVITPEGIPHARASGWLMVAGWETEPAPGALAVTSLHVAETGWP